MKKTVQQIKQLQTRQSTKFFIQSEYSYNNTHKESEKAKPLEPMAVYLQSMIQRSNSNCSIRANYTETIVDPALTPYNFLEEEKEEARKFGETFIRSTGSYQTQPYLYLRQSVQARCRSPMTSRRVKHLLFVARVGMSVALALLA